MKTNAKTRKKKSQYSTEFIRCYKAGLLNKVEIKAIPRSTRFAWRKRNIVSYQTPNYYSDKAYSVLELKYEKSLQLAKVLMAIIYCYKQAFYNKKICKIYTATCRNRIIIILENFKPNVQFKRCLNWLNISSQQYYAWKHRYDCKASLLKLCRKKFIQQLSPKEVTVIANYVNNLEFIHWSLSSIYCKMMVDKAAAMCVATFRKYAKLLSFNKPVLFKDKTYSSLKALSPLSILQMDVTIFRPADRSKVYIHILMDNFSRCILGCKASLSYAAKNSLELLEGAYTKYNLQLVKDISIVTDDGVENKNCFDEYILSTSNLKHLIAQKDIVQSNSMIEAVNKRIKYDFLFTKPLANFTAVNEFLVDAIPAYNEKPLFALSGYAPNEVLNGAVPNAKRFAETIATAAVERKKDNGSFGCCLAKT